MADNSTNQQYFEGILQLRNSNQEIEDFVRRKVRKRTGVFISKEKKLRNGVDFYMSSQHYLQSLGREVQRAFGGELKTSAKLFTRDRQKSRNVHRVNVLVRLPGFVKGDVIDCDGNLIKVVSLGKDNFGINIKTGKRSLFKYKKKKIEVIEIRKTQVAKLYPRLEILNPDDYQPIAVDNARLWKNLKLGEKVKAVFYKGVWVV